MSTHNICFYGEVTKIILPLSSNTRLISSSVRSVCPKLRIIWVHVLVVYEVLHPSQQNCSYAKTLSDSLTITQVPMSRSTTKPTK